MVILKITFAIMAIAVVVGIIAVIGDFLKPNSKHKPYGLYERFIKRGLDAFLATGAVIVLFPILLALSIIGSIKMKGNPFFTQERVGRNKKVFKLIKFRSMNSAKDKNGKLLPDVQRITSYGQFIRNTSLDELPELINILKGDMSIVGPSIYRLHMHGICILTDGITTICSGFQLTNCHLATISCFDGWAKIGADSLTVGINGEYFV